VLNSDDAKSLRNRLLREYELREICLFPDNVFEDSSVESAVILGRRHEPGLRSSVHYRRVREWDISAFEERLEASADSRVPQPAFLLKRDLSLKMPDLQEVWEHLAAQPRLAAKVDVQKGFEFMPRRQLGDREVQSAHRRGGWRKAILRA